MSTPSPGGARTRVAVGGLWAGLTWAVGIVTGPLLAIAIVRSMSHSQYGILVVAASAVGLLTVVSGLGLQAAVSQIAAAERVENPAGGEVATMKGAVTLGLRAALGGVVLAGAAALVFVAVRTLRPATVPLLALSPVVVVAPLAGVASGMYRVLHWPRKLALRTMVSSVALGVLIAVPLLFARVTPLQISGARALASVLALALLAVPLRGYYRGHAQRHLAAVPVKRIMPFASALMLGVAFTAALAELDVFLLGVFRGARVTGLYAPGAAMVAVVAGLPTIVGSLYLPNATDLAVRGELDQLSALYRFATRWSITVAAPALALLLVSPASVLSLVFGHGIESMASTLRVLGFGALVQIASGFNGITLDAFGLARVVAVRQVISLGISFVACLTLIPAFGPIGAAAATAIGYGAANVMCSTSLYRRFRLFPWDKAVLVTSTALAVAIGLSVIADHFVDGALYRCLVTAGLAGLLTSMAALVTGGRDERRAIAKGLRDKARKRSPAQSAARMMPPTGRVSSELT
jgi:O-antigen/teichoic acid export membrane protein